MTNPATWVAVLTPVVMIVSLAVNIPGFRAAPTWEGVLAASGIGLTLAMPLVAAGAAWSTASLDRSARRLAGVRTFLRRTLTNCAPLLLGTLIGYIACVALVQEATRATWGGPQQLLVVVPYAAVAVASVLIGAVIGSRLRAVAAVPAALIALYVIVALPLVDGNLELARNMIGFGLPFAAQSVHQQLALPALVAPVAIAAGLLGATAVAEYARPLRRILTGAVVAATGIGLAALIVWGLAVPPAEPRTAAERDCADKGGVTVCIWPEFAAESDSIRDFAASAHAALAAHSIPSPSTVVTGEVAAADELPWRISPGDPPDSRPLSFADAQQQLLLCTDRPLTDDQVAEQDRAWAALAIALGASPSDILDTGIPIDVTGITGDAAFDVYAAWAAQQEGACT